MPKYSERNSISKQGVNYIRSLVDKHNSIFHEIHQENDLGIDAIIEIIKNEKPTNKLIAIQIKSGKSYYVSKENKCKIPVNDHYEYWKTYPLEVYGIVYVPSLNVGFWVNIKNYIRTFSGCNMIEFDCNRTNALDADSFGRIFVPKILGEIPNLEFEKAIDLFDSDNYNEFFLGMVVLLRKYSDKELVWEKFIKYFIEQDYDRIPNEMIYYLAHIPWHPDIYSWGEPITKESRAFAQNLINQFDKDLIVKLMQFIDKENLISRGSTGQSVEAIVSSIPKVDEYLVEIIMDSELPMFIREYAGIIYAYHKEGDSIEVLNNLVKDGSWYIPELINYILEFGYLNPYQ
jgi:hypothetical protein